MEKRVVISSVMKDGKLTPDEAVLPYEFLVRLIVMLDQAHAILLRNYQGKNQLEWHEAYRAFRGEFSKIPVADWWSEWMRAKRIE